MKRVKCFYGVNNSESLGDKVDKWIQENKIDVHKVKVCATGRLDHHVTITVIYDDYRPSEKLEKFDRITTQVYQERNSTPF